MNPAHDPKVAFFRIEGDPTYSPKRGFKNITLDPVALEAEAKRPCRLTGAVLYSA